MAGYTAVDLSLLPSPDVVDTISFETILAEMLADLRARDATFDALVESDPAYKILEVAAYREVLIRQRVNEAARAVMLAHATGADLDNLAALFGVSRLVLDPGDSEAVPPVDPTYESDTDLRRRVQLAPEGFSVAGPVGAYVYHALSADGDVLDAEAVSLAPGEVTVVILSSTGDGTAPPGLLATVAAQLSGNDVRPLCDAVVVQSAEIVTYQIEATIHCDAGPDRAVVIAASESAAAEYVATQHRIGLDVTLSGIYAALHQPGVRTVDLVAPASNISVTELQASHCTAITLIDGGASA